MIEWTPSGGYGPVMYQSAGEVNKRPLADSSSHPAVAARPRMLLFSDAIGLVDGDPYSQYPKWNNLALVDADGDDLVDLASSGLHDRAPCG